MVVQELGWDEDTDDDLRAAVEDTIDDELLDEDTDEVVDVVLLWWRDGDGDLADALMDAIGPLADDGTRMGTDAEDRPAWSRRAQRDRRVRDHRGPDPDLGGEAGGLDRQQTGAAAGPGPKQR